MRLSLVSLSFLAAALASTPAIAQEHGHEHGDHGHQHDDHGHARDDHAHDDHGHDHGAHDHDEDPLPSGLRLHVETAGDLAAGRTARLTLTVRPRWRARCGLKLHRKP